MNARPPRRMPALSGVAVSSQASPLIGLVASATIGDLLAVASDGTSDPARTCRA
jgi:hypothetical protein